MNGETGNEIIDVKRRRALKLAALGAGSVFLGVVLAPYLRFFSRNETFNADTLKNFNIVETDSELKLYNKSGVEIMTIDKKDL